MKTPNQIMHSFRLHTLNNRSGCIGCAYRDPNKISAKCQHELFKDVREYIKQLKAERDAAVNDLKYVAACETCKEFHRSALTEPCLHCTKYGLLDSENKYEWRGIRKEK